MTRRRIHAEPRRPWNEAEDAVLKRLYPHVPTKDVVTQLPGRTITSSYQRARYLGLAKTAAFMASPASWRLDGIIGTATRFRKGHVPANKGRPFDSGGRSHLTRFRKGNKPHTWVPVGTTVKDHDGYWKVKVGLPNKWRYTHRIAWEEAHGPVPPSCAVRFRDGNPDNCDISNLELITRSQLMRKNSYHNYPQPIPQLVQLRGALVRKINRSRQAHEEQA